MKSISRWVVLVGAVPLSVLGLAACGGSTKNASASATASAAAPSGAASGRGGNSGLREFLESDAAKACLSAAGIAVPSFPARPSGARPSGATPPSGGFPSGARPSGARPSGGFGGVAGQDFTKIEAALKACGLTVPTPDPTRQRTTDPSPAPAS